MDIKTIEDRNVEHFSERLEKDNYTKDEVAKLLHNEAAFTTQKAKGAFKDYIPKADFDEVSGQIDKLKTELAPYKEKEFKDNVVENFGKLHGDVNRVDDFIKIAGIDGNAKPDDISNKALEMKKSGNYEFLFKNNDSGTVKGSISSATDEPKKPSTGPVYPRIGFFDIFKNKNK